MHLKFLENHSIMVPAENIPLRNRAYFPPCRTKIRFPESESGKVRKICMTDAATTSDIRNPAAEGETALPAYLFHQGTNYAAWKYMGVHGGRAEDGTFRYTFRVWAPNAKAVSVVGDLTDWQNGLPMTRMTKQGVWELSIVRDDDMEGTFYKFAVTGQDGITWQKAE